MISAKIIKDSINKFDTRLTTWELQYPRFIHSEIMTHRALSKNSASSRAIPVKTMINRIEESPAEPIRWGLSGKGMQDHGELSEENISNCQQLWNKGCGQMIKLAKELLNQGLHKQIANRVLEPWSHMTIICTGTSWENFFALRAHKDAQPEFQHLAFKMLDLYNESFPTPLKWGEWHIPYDNNMLPDNLSTEDLLKVATARCARVSYLNYDGDVDVEKDINLHDHLLKAGHFSPFEHIAQAMQEILPHQKSNFGKGFLQYRKLINDKKEDSRVLKKTYVNMLKYIEKFS